MIEQALHDRLTIVERTFDRERVDVGRSGRRHHPPLHLGDTAVRKQHDEVDIGEPREGLHRSPAGVARGRDHDGGALRALFQHVIHQPRDQLHRDVLEGERRAVKQLQQELMRADLVERHHSGMTEGGVGLICHAAEIGVGDLAAHERANHVDGHLPIGPAEESGDGLGVSCGQDSGT